MSLFAIYTQFDIGPQKHSCNSYSVKEHRNYFKDLRQSNHIWNNKEMLSNSRTDIFNKPKFKKYLPSQIWFPAIFTASYPWLRGNLHPWIKAEEQRWISDLYARGLEHHVQCKHYYSTHIQNQFLPSLRVSSSPICTEWCKLSTPFLRRF